MAMKRYEEKRCYVYDMPKHMYKPDDVKEGIKKVNLKVFPKSPALFRNPLRYSDIPCVIPKSPALFRNRLRYSEIPCVILVLLCSTMNN